MEQYVISGIGYSGNGRKTHAEGVRIARGKSNDEHAVSLQHIALEHHILRSPTVRDPRGEPLVQTGCALGQIELGA